jgi:hypothetical protein
MLIFTSIGVFPVIKVSPIYPNIHRLLLGGGGFFFGVRFFLGALLWQGPNKNIMRFFLGSVARQRPVSNNREVISLRSVPRTRYHGKIVLLVLPELQKQARINEAIGD